MRTLALILSGLIGLLVQARGVADTRLSKISVFIHPNFSDPNLRLPCAEKLASAIFAAAGVDIQWRMGRPQPHPTYPTILIDLTLNTPQNFHTGALAYALPFEGERIRVFWDRVKTTANDKLVTKVLAQVMVHEITHILQGVNHHSPEGIMKAHWTEKDLADLQYKPFSIDREDVIRIRDGLARRDSQTEYWTP